MARKSGSTILQEELYPSSAEAAREEMDDEMEGFCGVHFSNELLDAMPVHLLQAVRGRRTTLIVFYIDGASFGGADRNPTFDLGQDVDLYVVRKGDDFARLVRTRDAVRIA